ncbi:L-histidine N(alpha)-methyltransferase [Nostoc sp.]|uniref:L-histidine N(alpha)-methyltransferase n=1 Tax=Nostoc sp. TaxID=1180 RepID=UPI003FA5CA54
MTTPTQVKIRLAEAQNHIAHWRKWGPYLSDRQWGTVREDYSPNEMHLQSLKNQTAVLEALDYQVYLQSGETIRTEISRKFHLPSLVSVLENHALQPLQIWSDPQGWFGLILCQRQVTTHEYL